MGAWEGILVLFHYILEFVGYIIGFIFLVAIIYLLFIRPLVKATTEKGKRLYWIGSFILVIFGLIGFPLGIALLYKYVGQIAMWIGFGVFVVFLIILNQKLS